MHIVCPLGHLGAIRLRVPYKYRKYHHGSWSKTYSQSAHEIAKNEKKWSSQALGLLLPYFQFYMSNGILKQSDITLESTLRKKKMLSVSLMIKLREQTPLFFL